MVRYIVKRLAVGVVTLFLLATITFFLMHVIPGSPFAGETSKLPVKVLEKLYEKYGLDKPLMEQYVIYMKNAVSGDFGVSIYRKGRGIDKIISNGLPYTLRLGAVSVTFALAAGIFLGTAAAFTVPERIRRPPRPASSARRQTDASSPGSLRSQLMHMLGWAAVIRRTSASRGASSPTPSWPMARAPPGRRRTSTSRASTPQARA